MESGKWDGGDVSLVCFLAGDLGAGGLAVWAERSGGTRADARVAGPTPLSARGSGTVVILREERSKDLKIFLFRGLLCCKQHN